MKKSVKKIICIIISALFIINNLGFRAEAARKPINTAITDKSSETNIIIKAPAVKMGSNTVQMKKKRTCYVKFTAPSSRYYNLAFTPQFTDKQNKSFMLGYFQINRVVNGSFATEELSTYGGKYIALNIANKKYVKACKQNCDKAQMYRQKRNTTIWLEAGETIYISSYFQKSTVPTYIKYNLVIK
ncbi:MAG: hypothetical protein K6B68_01235 [Eubacterium sp.]|nr:hypothetical protein [Eubacterium sp.]